MSHASEWARGDQLSLLKKKIVPNHPLQMGLVMVERSGDCYLELTHDQRVLIGVSLSQDEALALARWILATFGEAPDA